MPSVGRNGLEVAKERLCVEAWEKGVRESVAAATCSNEEVEIGGEDGLGGTGLRRGNGGALPSSEPDEVVNFVGLFVRKRTEGCVVPLLDVLLSTCKTLSFSSCSSAFLSDCATLLAWRLCLMRVEVTWEASLGRGGGGGFELEFKLELGTGEGRVGEVERLTEMGGVAWCTEFEGGGTGGGGFRGGKGGDLVDDGSLLLPSFANGLCD